MNKKEARKLLDDTKVYVGKDSEDIQKKLFSLGYCWGDKDTPITKISCVENPFLYIHKTGFISCNCNLKAFIEYEYREIQASDIVNIVIDRHFKDGDIICSADYIAIFRCTYHGEVLTDSAIIRKDSSFFVYETSFIKIGNVKNFSFPTPDVLDNYMRRLHDMHYRFDLRTHKITRVTDN
jgi:hypothetical protein